MKFEWYVTEEKEHEFTTRVYELIQIFPNGFKVCLGTVARLDKNNKNNQWQSQILVPSTWSGNQTYVDAPKHTITLIEQKACLERVFGITTDETDILQNS